MTSPAPGWYPDPGGAAPYRWWDGQAWTTATHDGGTAAPQQAAPAAVAPTTPAAPQYGAAQTGYTPNPMFGGGATQGAALPGQTAGIEAPATAYGTKSPFDSQGQSSYASLMRSQQVQNNTFWHQNQTAMWTFIVTAIYIFIALSTGFGIIGFVPAALAYRSQVRGEPLALLAIGAAVIAVIIGVTTFTHHF